MKLFIVFILTLCSLGGMAQEAQSYRNTALSAKTAKAYEIKAEAKVKELFSYLELLTDPKLNPEMKEQVRGQVEKLFGTEAKAANFFNKKTVPIVLKDMLDIALKQKEQYIFTLSGFKVIPKGTDSAGARVWLVNYVVSYGKYTLEIEQPFYMADEQKQFGATTRVITATYLGSMKEVH